MAQYWLDIDSFVDGTNLVQEGIFENTTNIEKEPTKKADSLSSHIEVGDGGDKPGPFTFRYLETPASSIVEVYSIISLPNSFSGNSRSGVSILEENNSTSANIYFGFSELRLRGDYGSEELETGSSQATRHVLFRVNSETGDVLAKQWIDGQEEPSGWGISNNSSGIPSNLFGGIYADSRHDIWRAFSVGTDGDPAPQKDVQTVETIEGSLTSPHTAVWTPQDRHVGIVQVTPRFTTEEGNTYEGAPVNFEVESSGD